MPTAGNASSNCHRSGSFQIVFNETDLEPDLRIEITRHADEEWRKAVGLLLQALHVEHEGTIEANAAWQDITVWLHADERLETFIRRALQSIDAAIWLLSVAAESPGLEHRLRQAALSTVCD